MEFIRLTNVICLPMAMNRRLISKIRMSTKVFLYQYVTGEEEIVWVFAFYSLNSQK